MSLKPPSGPWASVLNALASPWTLGALLALLAGSALYGLVHDAPHPGLSLVMQAPAALLPFCVLAGGLSWPRVGWAAGLALALLGAAQVGGAEGTVLVGGPNPAESATFPRASGPVEVHLGGQLSARLEGDGVQLALGVGQSQLAAAVAPLDGAEVPFGEWSARVREIRVGDEPTLARFQGKPREGGEPWEVAVRAGRSVALPGGGQLAVVRISRDYGQSLGPAAEVIVGWGDGKEDRAWFFVDHPDLDERVGVSPWSIRLAAVEGEPLLEIGVRRGGPPLLAMAGWALMALALLVTVTRRES